MSQKTTDISSATAPPCYFLSLEIANVRCFGAQSQILKLADENDHPFHWTVLLGENGTGKTTLLQCLAFMQSTRYKMPDVTEIGDVFIPASDDYFSRLIMTWQYHGHIKEGEGLAFSQICGSVSHSSGIQNPIITQKYSYVCILGRSHQSTRTDLSRLICYGYGASRRMSRQAIHESSSSLTCRTLFEDESDLNNTEEWLILADYATKTGSQEQRQRASVRLSRIQELLAGSKTRKGLLPDVHGFRFTTTADSAMIPRVEAMTPYGWVRVRDLSLGYQTALAWVVDFASRMFERYPDSENPLAEPAICLVDEIDLHLHPKWQRELLRLLSDTFPNTQFIVTAHSPLIVQAAPNANLALLRRNGDHVEIINDVDYIRQWRVDQILASELFDEQPIHAPEIENLLNERTRLLSKSRLTAKDRARVAEIDAELDKLPSAARPDDQEAMDLIREAARILHGK